MLSYILIVYYLEAMCDHKLYCSTESWADYRFMWKWQCYLCVPGLVCLWIFVLFLWPFHDYRVNCLAKWYTVLEWHETIRMGFLHCFFALSSKRLVLRTLRQWHCVNYKLKRLILWGNYIRKKLEVHREITSVVCTRTLCLKSASNQNGPICCFNGL